MPSALALGAAGAVALVALAGGGHDALVLGAALLALWAVPGWLAVDALLPDRAATDALDRAVLSAAAGLALLVLTGWWASAAFGGLSPAVLAGAHLITAAALAGVAMRRRARGKARPAGRAAWAALAVVLAFGAALRLPGLGYSELQGDEAIVVAKAAALVDGRRDAYLVHKKGPAEILIAAQAHAARTGPRDAADGAHGAARIDERAARWPFALAMLVGLAGLFAVGRALFGWRVALAAALLLGVNGFFVAFGRVVQYQAVVFALSTAALLCAVRRGGAGDGAPVVAGEPTGPATAGAGAPRWWLLAALLLAVGILAHYDAALAGPAILVLAVRRWRRVPGAWRADRAEVAAGAALGAALLAAFFVPLVAHPYFRDATLGYLVDVRLGGDDAGWWARLAENLTRSTALATFYSPVWLGLALAALAAVELVRRARAGRSPGAGWWAVLAWWLVPLGFYFVLVASPRTHFHVAYPAWSLMAALGAAWAWERLAGRPGARAVAALAGAALLAACAWYAGYAFLQRRIEVRRVYPEGRPAGFPLPVADLPSSGWFGFPYRAGWKAIGALYADGALRGDYDSNEEPAITAWYTRGAPRCPERPRYAFVAERVQDRQPVLGVEGGDPAAAGYVRIGGVTSAGRERIVLYERADLHDASAEPIALAVEAVAGRFDRRLSGPRFDAGLPGGDPRRWLEHRHDARFGDAIRLEGWSLAGGEPGEGGADDAPEVVVRAGARLVLTLAWRAEADVGRDWNVFAHVEREGEATVGQSDGAPLPPRETVCGDESAPTSGWRAGDVVEDRRALDVAPDAAPGDYDLLVGLYDYATLERLPVVDGAGEVVGDRARLASVRVLP